MPPKTKAKTKLEKLTFSEAKIVVKDYLKKEYRPYGISDLVLNLHSKINKTSLTKILDELVEEGEVMVKTYGKSSFYCYQEITEEKNDEKSNYCKEESMDVETFNQFKQHLGELERDYGELKKEIAGIEAEPTNKEIQLQILELEQKKRELITLIDIINSENLTEQKTQYDAELIKENFKTSNEKFKRYMKIFKNLTSMIKENVDNFETLMEAIGVEPLPNM